MSDLFNDKPTDQTKPPEPTDLPESSYLDALVGEGKKFTSHEALARGKYESDLYVTQLQSENAGMRATITEQESVSDLLDKAFEGQAAAPKEPVPGEPVSDPAAPSITQEEISKLVETQVNSRLNADQKMANIKTCHDAAKAVYGEDYVNVLSDRAKVLGLGQKFLEGIAADQPAAFMKLLVDEKAVASATPATTPAPLPLGTVQTSVPGIQTKDFKFYQAILAKDKVEYWSRAVQMEIYAAAKAQGESFYD